MIVMVVAEGIACLGFRDEWVCVRRWTIFFFQSRSTIDDSTQFLSFRNSVEFWGFSQALRERLTVKKIKSLCSDTKVDIRQ